MTERRTEAERPLYVTTAGPIEHSRSQCRRSPCDCWCEACERHSARERLLRKAIQTVLDDEESRPGGWGPDVTMVAVLRTALDRLSEPKP